MKELCEYQAWELAEELAKRPCVDVKVVHEGENSAVLVSYPATILVVYK